MKPQWILYVQTLWLSYYLPITTEPSIPANFNSPTSRQQQACRAFFILPSNTSTDSHPGLLQVWSVVKYCSVHKNYEHVEYLAFFLTYIEIMFKDNLRPGCICCRLNLISGQNDFNLGWFVISLSLFMIMNTRDKEITDQPRLKSFWPEIKFNLQHICIHYVSYKTKGYRKHGFWTKARLYLNQIKLSYSHWSSLLYFLVVFPLFVVE